MNGFSVVKHRIKLLYSEVKYDVRLFFLAQFTFCKKGVKGIPCGQFFSQLLLKNVAAARKVQFLLGYLH
jgi:hypothetical protein